MLLNVLTEAFPTLETALCVLVQMVMGGTSADRMRNQEVKRSPQIKDAGLDAYCGGVLKANRSWNYIESPGYSDGAYSEDQKCSWVIQASPGTRIDIKFVAFGFLCATSCVDYVELKLLKDQRLTGRLIPAWITVSLKGPRFCCHNKPDRSLISESNTMAIIFRSQYSEELGFKLKFRESKSCGSFDVYNVSSHVSAVFSKSIPQNSPNWNDYDRCWYISLSVLIQFNYNVFQSPKHPKKALTFGVSGRRGQNAQNHVEVVEFNQEFGVVWVNPACELFQQHTWPPLILVEETKNLKLVTSIHAQQAKVARRFVLSTEYASLPLKHAPNWEINWLNVINLPVVLHLIWTETAIDASTTNKTLRLEDSLYKGSYRHGLQWFNA